MSLPTNRIKKVKLPNNTEYDIVPTMLQDGTTTNKLSVPTLSADDTVVTTGTTQTINGNKTFNGSTNFEDGISVNDGNVFVSQGNVEISQGHLHMQSDNTTSYTSEDWDTDFYPDRLQIENYGDGTGDSEIFTLQYPKLADGETATLGLQVDIVDLTQINS